MHVVNPDEETWLHLAAARVRLRHDLRLGGRRRHERRRARFVGGDGQETVPAADAPVLCSTCPGWPCSAFVLGDPWPETDAFLANLLGDRRSLQAGMRFPESGCDRGGLGTRPAWRAARRVRPRRSSRAADELMHVTGYRFATEDARKKVENWWQQTSEARPRRRRREVNRFGVGYALA